MSIIIFYEHIVRELDGCFSIANEINSNQDIKAYKFSLIFEYYEALSLAKKERIDMIVMPWLYSKKDYELVMPFIKLNPNIIIANLHHEQIGSVISDGAVIPRDEISKNSVIHFVWGENFKDILLKSGVEEELIFVTGNIRTDFIKKRLTTRETREFYSETYGLDPNKKWILYSENRDWVWGNKDNMKKVYLSSGCSKEDFEDFFIESVKSIEKTIESIRGLDDSFFEKFEFVYRPHPGTFINNSIDHRIKVINKGNIYEWLNAVDANIVSGSTTVYESELCGVPTLVDVSFYMNDKYQTYGVYDYYKINDFNDINEKLLDNLKNQMKDSRNYEKYLGIADGQVAHRIACQILEILDTEIESYRNSFIKINKTRFYGKFLREKTIKGLYKLNLLEKINWPKYAIRMKEDIPYKRIKSKGVTS